LKKTTPPQLGRADTCPGRLGVDCNDLLLLGVVLIWGTNTVVTKFLLQLISPLALLCVQAVGVSLLMSLALVLVRRQRLWANGEMLRAFVICGVILGVQRGLFLLALRLTTASEGALLMSTAPIWTAIIVAAFGLESLRRSNWVGIFLSLGGVALVVFGAARESTAYAPAPLAGDAAMFISAWLVALYMVVAKGWMDRFGSLRLVTVSNLVAALLILPLGFSKVLAVPWEQMSALHGGALFYNIVLAGTLGFIIWYWVVKRTSAARAAMYHYLLPVVAVLAAWLLLGEYLSEWQILGFAVILGGVYLARPLTAAREQHNS